jgi:hypothetical protein
MKRERLGVLMGRRPSMRTKRLTEQQRYRVERAEHLLARVYNVACTAEQDAELEGSREEARAWWVVRQSLVEAIGGMKQVRSVCERERKPEKERDSFGVPPLGNGLH